LGVGQPTCARLTQPAPNDKVIADFRARTTARPSEPVCVTFADLARLQETGQQEAGLQEEWASSKLTTAPAGVS